jgi:hypothetical protein
MRLLCSLFALYFGLLSCLPPNADAHELAESLTFRNHHEQAHHDSTLLDFLLDHYAGQSAHRHDDGGQQHQSLPFHHAHDCAHAAVDWVVAVVVVPAAPPTFPASAALVAAYAAGAPAGVSSTCWQPPRA